MSNGLRLLYFANSIKFYVLFHQNTIDFYKKAFHITLYSRKVKRYTRLRKKILILTDRNIRHKTG